MQSTSKVYQLGPNGLQELKPAPALEIGTKIIAVGYAGMIQNFAVYDTARHVVEIDTHEYLDAYFSPLNTLDEYTRPISEKFGIGFYYDLSAPKYTAEEIAAGLERAKRMEQAEQERKTQRDEAEHKAMAEARKNFPYLKENARGAEVSANLRKELREVWPSVRFSVRYKSFSGGDEITVKYSDGPRIEDVKAIAYRYQDHSADHTGDYWDYTPNAFNKVFGGVSFVFVERDFTPETIAKAAEVVARACPDLTKEIHREQFFEQHYPNGTDAEIIHKAIGSAAWIGPQSLARWVANLEDYTPAVEVKQSKETAPTPEGLQVVEYSAKCFVITGQTREIKDTLKSLGGKFNARLSCGAGWVFPATKRAEVINALNL